MANPNDRPEIQLALAVALHRSGQDKEAKKSLETLQSSTPEINAQRLYNLGEIARSSGDEDGFLRYLGELRQSAPTSLWLQQALLSAGNFYLLKPDYDKAIDAYRELQQRFPNAGRASYAHWKVAWLSLRQGRTAEAKAGFEQQIALYPTSAEIPAALYWRARLAEEDKDNRHGARLLPEGLGALPEFLLRRTGAAAPAEILSRTMIPAHYALLDRVPAIERRYQH